MLAVCVQSFAGRPAEVARQGSACAEQKHADDDGGRPQSYPGRRYANHWDRECEFVFMSFKNSQNSRIFKNRKKVLVNFRNKIRCREKLETGWKSLMQLVIEENIIAL